MGMVTAAVTAISKSHLSIRRTIVTILSSMPLLFPDRKPAR
jgi:hypothetical protein